jgi:phosphate transport system substrate-binding protein
MKPSFRVWLVATMTTVSLPVAPASGQSPSGALIFAGAGANLSITRRLAEAFTRVHPEIAVRVPESLGSTGGIQAAAEGAIALGLVSRPLRGREKALGLTIVPYARTAVVIGAHATVVDDSLTSQEIVQIYKGTKTRWRDGREIVVLTREPGDSSVEVLEEKIPGFREAHAEGHRARRWITLSTDQEMQRALAQARSGIGLLDMGAITAERLPIKALKLDGVAPTPENVLSGTYPLAKTLAFAFRSATLPPGAKAFLEFVRSNDGTRILKQNGYVPID